MIKPNKDQVAELRVSFEQMLEALGFLDEKPFDAYYKSIEDDFGVPGYASTDPVEGYEAGEDLVNGMFLMHCADKGFNITLGIAE